VLLAFAGYVGDGYASTPRRPRAPRPPPGGFVARCPDLGRTCAGDRRARGRGAGGSRGESLFRCADQRSFWLVLGCGVSWIR